MKSALETSVRRDLIRRIVGASRLKGLHTYERIGEFLGLDREEVMRLFTGQSDDRYSEMQLERFLGILEAIPNIPDHIANEYRRVGISSILATAFVIACIVGCYIFSMEMFPFFIIGVFLGTCWAGSHISLWCMFYLEYKWRDMGEEAPREMSDSRAAFLMRKLRGELEDCLSFILAGAIILGFAIYFLRNPTQAMPLWGFLASFFAMIIGSGLVVASVLMAIVFYVGFRRDHRDGHFPR